MASGYHLPHASGSVPQPLATRCRRRRQRVASDFHGARANDDELYLRRIVRIIQYRSSPFALAAFCSIGQRDSWCQPLATRCRRRRQRVASGFHGARANDDELYLRPFVAVCTAFCSIGQRDSWCQPLATRCRRRRQRVASCWHQESRCPYTTDIYER